MNIRFHRNGVILFFTLCSFSALAQPATRQIFNNITLRIDTALYSWENNRLEVRGEPHLWFAYQEENPMVELRFYPRQSAVRGLSVLPGNGFQILDSLLNVNDEYYRLKLRLQELTQTDFLSVTLQVNLSYSKTPYLYELHLFPITHTMAYLPEEPHELFIGEEKSVRLETNNPENIILPNVWTTGLPVNYAFRREEQGIFVQLMPNRLGTQEVHIPLRLHKPFLDEEGQPVYQLPPVEKSFTVKPAKLSFLSINQREVSFEQGNSREALEIELAYDSKMKMQKTYRLEGQEEPGGPLIAEIFTRNVLGNGRVLCWLRLYDYHRRNQGYLYIKDGDKAVYITNLDIIPETKVNKVSLRREGQDWQAGNDVFPGERIDIRIEGQSLHKADIRFDGLAEVRKDSLIQNDREVAFSGAIPLGIAQKNITIYNGSEPSGQVLRVREYERPRPFDYISLLYGGDSVALSGANQLIFVEETLPDITLHFDYNLIDQGRLYGRQELEIDIEVREKSNALVDQREIRNLIICPGEASPRHSIYPEEGCRLTDIKLNEYLRKKTFELETWTTIRLSIRQKPEKYGKNALSKTVEFVLHKKTTFDIDVSFPAGLVVKRFNESGFGNLGGISMAMMAQFSFYKDRQIARAKPYKFGAGFLAFNAFNFSESNNDRDVGIVVLASLYPIPSKDRSRLSFPLYAGGGYFLSKSKWFLLFGPGIRVSF